MAENQLKIVPAAPEPAPHDVAYLHSRVRELSTELYELKIKLATVLAECERFAEQGVTQLRSMRALEQRIRKHVDERLEDARV